MSATRSEADTQTERDRDADHVFADVYREQSSWLLSFFRRQIGNTDDAQDLAQETMLRFLRIAPSSDIVTPQAYLRRIATNLLRDRFDHSATKLVAASVPLIEGMDFEAAVDQHRDLAGRDELALWEVILAELKPRTLEIFLLSRIDGFTYKEIAERFGMTVWNVKRHMRQAIGHVERNRRVR